MKKVIVLGAGAIGSVVGGLLAKAGHEVTLVGRDPHLEAVERDGLRIVGLWGDHHVKNLKCVRSPEEIPEGTACDVALVTTKSYDTRAILEKYAGRVAGSGCFLSLQNGLGNVETLEAFFPSERVAGARVIFGVKQTSPGLAEVTVSAEPTALGWAGRPRDAVLTEIAAVLDSAGVPAEAVDDVYPYLWEKVLYNGALNPLGTILSLDYGALLENEHAREIMKSVVGEIFQVLDCLGIRVRHADADAYLKTLFEKLIPLTAGHRASMWFDISRGDPTEIEAINGYAVRLAKERGLRLPVNETLTAVIHALELKGKSHG